MQLHLAFSKMAKPVVTAINGAAMGGGAGLAIAGDLAVMAESAKLGYPETRHGIVAAIVMANLVRQVGRKAGFRTGFARGALDFAESTRRSGWSIAWFRDAELHGRSAVDSRKSSPNVKSRGHASDQAAVPRSRRPAAGGGVEARARNQQAHARVSRSRERMHGDRALLRRDALLRRPTSCSRAMRWRACRWSPGSSWCWSTNMPVSRSAVRRRAWRCAPRPGRWDWKSAGLFASAA